MDSDSLMPLIVTVLLLLALAFYFAVAETALASVSRNRIKIRSERGDTRAKNVMIVLDDFDRAITTLLICTNIVHLTIASVVTVFVTRQWGLTAVSVSTIVTTLVVFFAGEMLPKSIGKKSSESCSLACAGPLLLCMKVLSPLSKLLTAIGNLAAGLTKVEPEVSVTEDELYDMIEDMEEEGTIDEDQGDLFSSALQFSDVTVDSILTPRVDMEAVNASDPKEEILEQIRKTNHSRLPVYEDTRDNIIGVLQTRDYLKSYLRLQTPPDVRKLVDTTVFVHQGTSIDDLLELMNQQKVNLAVVTDSYGGTMGVVTIEDILEELVGEIWDEDDLVDEPVTKISDTVYLVDGEETVEDALEEIGMEPFSEEDEEAFTNLLMSEWVYEQFPHMPRKGDSFTYHQLKITVAQMEKNRIRHVRVTILPSEEGGEES